MTTQNPTILKKEVYFPEPENIKVEVEVEISDLSKERYDAIYAAAIKSNLDRKYTMRSLWSNHGITVRSIQ